MFFRNEETISIGWSQDQHVFHKLLGADRPLDALRRAFPDDERTGQLACLFYGGDFWDHEVPYTHPELWKVHDYIGWRLKSAVKRNYSVRVLEGTPSHDRGQCRIWESINNALQEPADFKYIDKLSIESHPILGDILYIPDCWKPTTDETWEDVKALMASRSITMVDWIIMHGAFKHQLPEHLHGKTQLHDSERYSSICRKYVLVGHVHVKSQYKNIISIGSIERLSHNEEEPKGSLRINCTENKGDEILFQENKLARLAITLTLTDVSVEESTNRVKEELAKYHESQLHGISIRLVARKTDPAYFLISKLSTAYPDVHWSFKDVDQKKNNIHLVRLVETTIPTVNHDLSINAVKKNLLDRIGDGVSESLKDKVDLLFEKYKINGVKNEQSS